MDRNIKDNYRQKILRKEKHEKNDFLFSPHGFDSLQCYLDQQWHVKYMIEVGDKLFVLIERY